MPLRYQLDSSWPEHDPADQIGRWVWDIATDRVSASKEYFGLLGMAESDLDPPDLGCFLKKNLVGWERVVAATKDFLLDRPVSPPVFRATQPDGSERLCVVSARKVRDGSGGIVQVRGRTADISSDARVTAAAIAAGDALQRQAVRAAFAKVEWGRVVAEASSLATAEGVDPRADVLIAVVGPDDMDDVRALRESRPSLPVLAVVNQKWTALLPGLIEMNVDCFVTAQHLPELLELALLAARSGQRFVAPSFFEALLGRTATPPPPAPRYELNSTESDVLRLLAGGMRNTEIAKELYLSLPTVKRYTQRVYAKLGARDRAQAVDIAHRSGLI